MVQKANANKPKQKKQPKPAVKSITIRGKGAYSADTKFAKGMADIGTSVGTKFGSWLGGIFGFGSYRIKQNSVFNSMSQQVPFMHSSSESIILRHREYIADVSSTAAFTSTVYAINPGLNGSFPYLSTIAQAFQEYEFKGLAYEFKSTSADALNSTNTALGSVSMAIQYRTDANAFVDKQQLLNEMWAVDGKPSDNNLIFVECAPMDNPFKVQYVRGSAVPSGQDAKMYDLGKLTVATYGSQATAVVGELWATYEIVLRKPQLSSGLNLYGRSAHVSCSTCSTGSYLANSVATMDSIGLTIAATTITFPLGTQGHYIVSFNWSGTSAVTATVGAAGTNCSASPFTLANGGLYIESPQSGVTATAMTETFILSITDPTKVALVTLSGGTIPTNSTCDLIVCQLSYPFA